MTTVYFAHAMTDYGNEREARALTVLHTFFEGERPTIINPSEPEHSAAAVAFKRAGMNPMDYFYALVRESDEVAFLPTHDNLIGPGVMKELVEGAIFGKKLSEIKERGVVRFDMSRVLTIAEMRSRLS